MWFKAPWKETGSGGKTKSNKQKYSASFPHVGPIWFRNVSCSIPNPGMIWYRCIVGALVFFPLSKLPLVTLKSWPDFFSTRQPLQAQEMNSSVSHWLQARVLFPAWFLYVLGFRVNPTHRELRERECTCETLRRQTWLPQFYSTQHIQRWPFGLQL